MLKLLFTDVSAWRRKQKQKSDDNQPCRSPPLLIYLILDSIDIYRKFNAQADKKANTTFQPLRYIYIKF